MARSLAGQLGQVGPSVEPTRRWADGRNGRVAHGGGGFLANKMAGQDDSSRSRRTGFFSQPDPARRRAAGRKGFLSGGIAKMNDLPIEKAITNQRRCGFQKGISGNPARKPKGTKSRANQLMDKLFSKNPDDLQKIVDVTIAAARRAEPWAVEAILKRLWIPAKDRLVT